VSLEQTKLPDRWVWASIEQLGEVVTGSTPQKKDPAFFGGNIPFYKPTDLDFGYEVVDAREYLSELGVSQSRLLPALSVLVTCIGATIGKTGLARRQCTTNQQINAVILPDNYINPYWFFWAIGSPQGQQMIIENASATTLPIINKGRFSELIFPVPPFNEQRRIVAKIEALKARSQQVKEALEAIPPLLEQFRQSVLAAAFRGDLTADWREKNPDLEPASVLLERICIERRYKWHEEVSKKGKNLSKAKYQDPINTDINKLPELPDNWTWATLDQLLFALRNGLSKPPADQSPGIPILRISAVRAMEVNINDLRFYRTNAAEDISYYLLETGDLLFTRYNGSRSFVGVCGLVPKLPHDLLYPDKLIRGQVVDKSLCLPEYLAHIPHLQLSHPKETDIFST